MNKAAVIAIILVAIVGFGVLVIAACAGLIYMGYRSTDVAVSPKVDDLFEAIADDRFAETYETETTPEFRAVTTRQQYEALGRAIRNRLGALQSKSMRGFKMRQVNANSYMDVSYAATFEKGTGTITATMKKLGDDWKFVSFYVSSPEFLKDAPTTKCGSCGKTVDASARYCPSCGARLSKTSDQESAVTQ
jgi:hypothetical protein